MFSPVYFKVTKGIDDEELEEILLDIGILGTKISGRDMEKVLATLEDEFGFRVQDFGSWIRCESKEFGVYLDFYDLRDVNFYEDLERAFDSWARGEDEMLMEIEGDFLAVYIPARFRGRLQAVEEGFVIDRRDIGMLFDILFEINRSPDARVLKQIGGYEGYASLEGKEIGIGRRRINGFVEFGMEYAYDYRREFQVIVRYLDISHWVEERIIFAGL